MLYFDYSATTFSDEEVLKTFIECEKKYCYNPNSHYDISQKCLSIIKESTNKIAKYLNIKPEEIIYTSGASESNNTIIKGILDGKRKHIITTKFEHSSVLAPLSYLQNKGYKISFVPVDNEGIIDLKELERLIKDDTLLVSIGAVNSELGIREPVEEIGLLLKKYNVYFHSDITQALGKTKIDLTNVDLASFSAHKIYGIKGIGGLIKKDNINLIPLIHGGKSTTIYRSGTPQTSLIVSMAKAFNLIFPNVEKNYEYVSKLNNLLVSELSVINNIFINSPKKSIPHILNISIINKLSDDIQKSLASKKIYLSTKTACSSDNPKSLAVYEITTDEKRSISSVRISLSYKTTLEDVKILIKELKKIAGEK